MGENEPRAPRRFRGRMKTIYWQNFTLTAGVVLLTLALLGASYEPMLIFVLASGGFLTFGLLLGIINAITAFRAGRKERGGERA